jgi:pantoate--beta-alanine ligase
VTPDIAFFGQKDAQQSVIIKQMVADLNMPLEIIICPTVRESDGLAVSSRNQYLNKQQRQDAVCLYKSLQKSLEMVNVGTTDTEEIITEMKKILNQKSSIEIEYVNIVNYETLEDIDVVAGKALVAVAVKLGPARLIDNILIDTCK